MKRPWKIHETSTETLPDQHPGRCPEGVSLAEADPLKTLAVWETSSSCRRWRSRLRSCIPIHPLITAISSAHVWNSHYILNPQRAFIHFICEHFELQHILMEATNILGATFIFCVLANPGIKLSCRQIASSIHRWRHPWVKRTPALQKQKQTPPNPRTFSVAVQHWATLRELKTENQGEWNGVPWNYTLIIYSVLQFAHLIWSKMHDNTAFQWNSQNKPVNISPVHSTYKEPFFSGCSGKRGWPWGRKAA